MPKKKKLKDTGLRGKELAYAALDHIRENRKEWKQDVWHCGTAYCYAGHIVIAAGGDFITPESSFMEHPAYRFVIHAEDMALSLLGVDRSFREAFDGDNKLNDIKRVVREHFG